MEEGVGGFIVTEAAEAGTTVDQQALFDLHGLDADDWTITRARSSRWQQRSTGQEPIWLEASRIEFEPRAVVRAAVADAEKIISQIAKWRPRTPPPRNKCSLWVPVGDTQIGKIEGGGTTATVERFLDNTARMVHRQKTIKAEHVWLPWLGDCIEGVVSQKGKVRGRLDLSITKQLRVLRRLQMAQIKVFAPVADIITLVGIPGNHDETTRDLFTEGTDSWALEALATVDTAIGENPELRDRVKFLYPDDDTLTVTIDDQGQRVTMAHGHQFPVSKSGWESWWDEQIRARTLPGDADILLAAHRHHLVINDFAGRMFIQIPALDGGSRHYEDRHGGGTPSRLVSFVLEDGRIRDFDPIL